MAVILSGVLVIIVAIALQFPFPSPFDELAQFSAVRSQFENADLFADTRRYYLVMASDPARWTAGTNYMTHPALYYLGMAPLLQFGQDVLLVRLANVALTMLALLVIVSAGCRIFQTQSERILFTLLAVSFPKTALIGGMVNNDNLAFVAAAAVFAGLFGGHYSILLIAGGLALAGWTKLTALVALVMIIAAKILLDGPAAIWRRDTLWIGTGVAIGCVPFLANLIQSGTLFHVNTTVFGLPPEARPDASFAQFLMFFMSGFANKWVAAEGSVPVAFGAILALAPLIFAVAGTALDERIRKIGLAYLAGTIGTLIVHIAFGWHAFQTIGDLTISQTRYYNVLWPGLALAGAAAIARLRNVPLVLTLSMLAYLTPTVIGGMMLAILR